MEVAAKLVVQERGSDPEVNPLRPRTAGMLVAVALQVAKAAMLFPAALVIILIRKYSVYDLGGHNKAYIINGSTLVELFHEKFIRLYHRHRRYMRLPDNIHHEL